MCQIARFAAQSENATRGRSSVPSTARTRALRAIGASTGAGRRKTSSGPRSAAIISAGPRSPIRTCWPMWAERSLLSARLSSGPTSANSVSPSPAAKSAILSQPARSARPRRRRRTTAWTKRSAASAAKTTGSTDGLCPLIGTCPSQTRRNQVPPSVGGDGSAVSLQAEMPRDDHPLHLVRTLADLEDLLVAVEPRDRELLHEAVATVDLEGGVDDSVREDPREELRLCGGERVIAALILEPRRAVDELAAGVDLRRHVRELELDRLELRDRLAELPPLLRVGEREVVRALRQADAHRRDRDPAAVENLHELLEAAPALAEEILLGHRAGGERQLARVGCVPAELVHRRRDLVAGRPVRDDEIGDLAVSRLRGDRDAEADLGAGVRDEDLRAVDHPVPVAEPRLRPRRAGVRPGVRLRQPERREPLSRRGRGSHSRFCSSLPKRRIGIVPSDVCAATVIATDESIRVSSSIAIAYETVSPPAPPYSSGTGSPISPSSPSWATRSYGNLASRSSSSATGATFDSANSRTVLRISSCSSESSKFTRTTRRARRSGERPSPFRPARGGSPRGSAR